MKRKDISALHHKTVVELDKELKEKRQQLVQFRLEVALRKQKNVNLGRSLSDDIARISTILKARKLFNNLQDKSKTVSKEKKV